MKKLIEEVIADHKHNDKGNDDDIEGHRLETYPWPKNRNVRGLPCFGAR